MGPCRQLGLILCLLLSIELEPRRQHRLLRPGPRHHIVQLPVLLEEDLLVARGMDVELLHARVTSSQLEPKQPPARLCRTDAQSVEEVVHALDIFAVLLLREGYVCSGGLLVHVLEHVLDALDAGAHHHVQVTVVALEQVHVVRDDVPVVQPHVFFEYSSPIVRPAIHGIPTASGVVRNRHLFPELHRVPIFAPPIPHASLVARAVQHVPGHQIEPILIRVGVWNPGTRHLLDPLPCLGDGVIIQPHQHVHVGQAPLLELDSVRERLGSAEHLSFQDIILELLQLGVEHARDDVWPVLGRLAIKQLTVDL